MGCRVSAVYNEEKERLTQNSNTEIEIGNKECCELMDFACAIMEKRPFAYNSSSLWVAIHGRVWLKIESDNTTAEYYSENNLQTVWAALQSLQIDNTVKTENAMVQLVVFWTPSHIGRDGDRLALTEDNKLFFLEEGEQQHRRCVEHIRITRKLKMTNNNHSKDINRLIKFQGSCYNVLSRCSTILIRAKKVWTLQEMLSYCDLQGFLGDKYKWAHIADLQKDDVDMRINNEVCARVQMEPKADNHALLVDHLCNVFPDLSLSPNSINVAYTIFKVHGNNIDFTSYSAPHYLQFPIRAHKAVFAGPALRAAAFLIDNKERRDGCMSVLRIPCKECLLSETSDTESAACSVIGLWSAHRFVTKDAETEELLLFERTELLFKKWLRNPTAITPRNLCTVIDSVISVFLS